MIIGPIHGHRRRIRCIGDGALDGHLATLLVIVHVILAAAIDRIPHITVDNTIVVTTHIQCIVLMSQVSVFVTHQLPPFVIRMQRLVGVPRIIHHL